MADLLKMLPGLPDRGAAIASDVAPAAKAADALPIGDAVKIAPGDAAAPVMQSAPAVAVETVATPPERSLKLLAKNVWHHVAGAKPNLDPSVSERIDTLLAEPDAYKGYRFLGRMFVADWAKKSAVGLLETLPANELTGPQLDLVARLAVRVAKRQVDSTNALLMSGGVGLGAAAAVAGGTALVPYLWAQPVAVYLGGLFVGSSMARANDALNNMSRAFNYRLQFSGDGIPEAFRDELTEIFIRVQTEDGRPLGPRADAVNISIMNTDSLQRIAVALTDARGVGRSEETRFWPSRRQVWRWLASSATTAPYGSSTMARNRHSLPRF